MQCYGMSILATQGAHVTADPRLLDLVTGPHHLAQQSSDEVAGWLTGPRIVRYVRDGRRICESNSFPRLLLAFVKKCKATAFAFWYFGTSILLAAATAARTESSDRKATLYR